MAFLVICVGITILQMSKVDPASLTKLDRRSTILLAAARRQTELVEEKAVQGIEDPGIDTVRGFGAVGSILRARRLSQSHTASVRSRVRSLDPEGMPPPSSPSFRDGMRRHQLYDAPVPLTVDTDGTAHNDGGSSATGADVFLPRSSSSLALSIPEPPQQQQRLTSARSTSTLASDVMRRPTALTFQNEDVVHSYTRPGQGDNAAIHEHRLPRSSSSAASLSSSAVAAAAAGTAAPQLPPLPLSPLAESGYPPPSARTLPPLSPSPRTAVDEASTPMQGNTLRQQVAQSLARDQQAQQQQLRGPASATSSTGMVVPPPRSAATPRPDARDVFAQGVEAPGGLLPSDRSSPTLQTSQSESALSEEGQLSDADADDVTSPVAGPRPVRRSYPRGGPDDGEERVSLWHRRDESEENLAAVAAGGSIRLVHPSTCLH
jgi:hypothetical protein